MRVPRYMTMLLLVCALPATAGAPGPASEAECLARQGRWARMGEGAIAQCVLPTGDAGKACRDHAECESRCLAPPGTPAGQSTAGVCAADTDAFGCREVVRRGRAMTICVD